MTCRICLDEGDLIQPCNCTGTTAYVHEECLMKWLNISDRRDCEICKFDKNHKSGGRNKVSCSWKFLAIAQMCLLL